MPDAKTLLIIAAIGFGYYYVGKPVAHGVKKTSHAVCHVVTLGKKCK